MPTMNLFEIVKASVSVPEAARAYGLDVTRHNMARCPFHDDRHPSLKLNPGYYYCFGCGARGDVIDLVAGLFDLSPYEAAGKIAADFGIDPDKPLEAVTLEYGILIEPAMKPHNSSTLFTSTV